jgi:8-oxo-dGTP pyrophosphatase MutT (NUDIX family)
MLENQCIGLVRTEFADSLIKYPGAFRLMGTAITLNENLKTVEQRTDIISETVYAMIKNGDVAYIVDEPYSVKGHNNEVFFIIDRAMVPFLGFRSFGQHINGFTRKPDGLYLWIATRARDRRIFPGMLDNMVAGGLPHGLSLQENLVKECHEEAGMPAELALQAKPVSAITYNAISEKGYKPDTLYCYDIELSEEFIPVNTDGEVEKFELLSVDEVIIKVRQGGLFKPNCNLVLIDFFARQGLLDASAPEFLEIQQGLHVPFWYSRFE